MRNVELAVGNALDKVIRREENVYAYLHAHRHQRRHPAWSDGRHSGRPAAATGGYDVSGRVIDEATGQPIPKIKIGWSALEIAGKGASIRMGGQLVDEQGAFRLPNLAPGRYAVYVPIDSGSEYYSDEVAFEVVDRNGAWLEIKARREPERRGRNRGRAIHPSCPTCLICGFRSAGYPAGWELWRR